MASSAPAGSAEPVPAAAHVAIALGSNLGDRRAHLAWALEQLAAHVTDLRVSTAIETEPVDVPDVQPPYLNAVAIGITILAPRALLDTLLALEHQRGRTRASFRAARTLDLDLILYGDRIIDEPGLVIPHAHFRTRRFVLDPLAALAPAWIDPVTGLTMAALRDRARRS
jgi:2-amino-4-hydroxy-6-hydroxymethyldihydropteridine diphosphokinase